MLLRRYSIPSEGHTNHNVLSRIAKEIIIHSLNTRQKELFVNPEQDQKKLPCRIHGLGCAHYTWLNSMPQVSESFPQRLKRLNAMLLPLNIHPPLAAEEKKGQEHPAISGSRTGKGYQRSKRSTQGIPNSSRLRPWAHPLRWMRAPRRP